MAQEGSYKIDNRYETVKSLGDGLSGEVLLVSDQDGLKALKFLKKVQLNVSREDALKNFKNEFTILKELNHPNIARILDFGFDERLQKYYFTTEYVAGAMLDKACEGQPFDVVEKLLVQVLRALNYLHARGTYHFDIKPQNILVKMVDGKPETAKIIDFGLAGYASPRKRVGTPAYMAPEVVQGGVLDGRTDLYSLGVVIYKIFTGENPFAASNLKETLENQVTVVPEAPSSVRSEIPEYWDHIVRRLLEKNPINRYSQASLVIRDLNFLSRKSFEVETRDTKLSYLPEKGTLIGREPEWKTFTDLFAATFLGGETAACRLLVVAGGKGAGKTRLLSEIKYYSQLANVPVRTLRQFRSEPQELNQFILMADEDVATADEINALLQELAGSRGLIVWGTENPPENWANTVVVKLGNYTRQQLKQYIESVTGLEKAPDALIEELFSRTQGNPLLVTEFVKALLNQDLLYDNSGKWDATTFEDIKIDFDKLYIPETVEDYLASRYTKLSPQLAEPLNWLAVHGAELDLEDLSRLMPHHSGGGLQGVLLQLIEGEFVKKTTREQTYYFHNPVYADVILKFLSRKDLQSRHDKLARLFEGDSARRRAYLRHLSHVSDRARAAAALEELARLYTADHEYEAAAATWQKLLDLADDGDAKGREVAFQVAEALCKARRFDKASEILAALKTRVEADGGTTCDAERVRILQRLALCFFLTNRLDRVEGTLREAESLWQGAPDSADALIFRNYLAHLKFKRGELDEAERIFQETHRVWSASLNDEERQRVSNNRLADVYIFRKKYGETADLCRGTIEVLEKLGATTRLATLHYLMGDVYYRLTNEGENGAKADYSQLCLENFQKCEKIAREIDDYANMLRAFNGIGNLYYEKNQMEDSLQYYQRALAIARKSSDLMSASVIALNIGGIYLLKLGKTEDAYSYLIYAVNTLESIPNKNNHEWLYLVLCYEKVGEIYRQRRQLEKADSCLDKIDSIVSGRDYLAPHLFRVCLLRLKLHYDREDDDKFEAELVRAKALAKGVSDRDELRAYLVSIDHRDARDETGGEPAPRAEVAPSGTAAGVPAKKPASPGLTRGYKMLTENNSVSRGDDDLKRIIEINDFINSERDIGQLLKLILNYALQLSKAEAGFVVLLEEDGSFNPAYSINASDGDQEKISMSIVRMALESGEIVSSSDAVSDARFDSSESVVMNELKSILCLPIKSKNKAVGVFYLDNRYRTNVFETCNVALLKAFCDQVGIALENARLINKLKEAQERLQDKLQKTEAELAEARSLLVEESGVFQTKYTYSSIVSKSKEMREVFKLLDKVTETNLAVFLHGESGTGKELVAKALHYNNPTRATKKFVAINCGAIPANLMESELFGHKMGSFTGAIRDKKGMFEDANGGTLFLDEIGELAPELQVKLLRVLQEGEVQRIGDNHAFKVDVRVVSASLKDIEIMVRAGKFREDLYYRLCQMRINLPPLRDRKEDITGLAKHFVKKYCQQNKIEKIIEIPVDFMRALLDYDWSGNVRELENTIYVACALQENGSLHLESLPDHYGIKKAQTRGTGSPAHMSTVAAVAPELSTVMIDEHNRFDPTKTWREYETLILCKCYESSGKKKKQVSDSLDLSHSTVYKKIEELNLDDDANPVYVQSFTYDPRHTMRDYVSLVFQAALKHHGGHPYAAIRQLDVSQGYFYKVIKQGKTAEPALAAK